MDLKHEGKSLEELNVEECFELEKILLKRILQASTAMMNEGTLSTQLELSVTIPQMRKQELIPREKMGLDKKQVDGATVDTNENEQEQTLDDPNEQDAC